MIHPKQAVVYKANTLGLLSETFGQPSIGILHGLISKGGVHFSNSPILFAKPTDYRLATMEDFEKFGVVHNENYLIAPLSKSLETKKTCFKSSISQE